MPSALGDDDGEVYPILPHQRSKSRGDRGDGAESHPIRKLCPDRNPCSRPALTPETSPSASGDARARELLLTAIFFVASGEWTCAALIHVIDKAVLLGLHGGHEEVAVAIFFESLDLFPGGLA